MYHVDQYPINHFSMLRFQLCIGPCNTVHGHNKNKLSVFLNVFLLLSSLSGDWNASHSGFDSQPTKRDLSRGSMQCHPPLTEAEMRREYMGCQNLPTAVGYQNRRGRPLDRKN